MALLQADGFANALCMPRTAFEHLIEVMGPWIVLPRRHSVAFFEAKDLVDSDSVYVLVFIIRSHFHLM